MIVLLLGIIILILLCQRVKSTLSFNTVDMFIQATKIVQHFYAEHDGENLIFTLFQMCVSLNLPLFNCTCPGSQKVCPQPQLSF